MRIRFRQAVILGIVLAVGGGGQPVAAQQPAYPGGTLAAIDYRVELSGQTDVCTNVEYTYSVHVVKYYGYDNGTTRTYVRQGDVPATLRIDVAGRTASGRTRLFGGTSFPARFPSAGPYTITVTGSGVPIIPGSNISAHVDPATLAITAKSCDFELTTISIWSHLPDGFKPWVGAVTNPVRLHPDNYGLFDATAHLTTTAIGGAQGGCQPTFDVEDVDAVIHGFYGTEAGLSLTIDFTPGTSHTRVVCGPKSGSDRPSRFSLDQVNELFSPGLLSGTSMKRAPSVLHASSNVSGGTYLIVTPLP